MSQTTRTHPEGEIASEKGHAAPRTHGPARGIMIGLALAAPFWFVVLVLVATLLGLHP